MGSARQIGPFEVLEALGAGGMGEVFRARDTRLNRNVAIKFLPEAASPLARERFQREAQAIAALNHPNICTLYEVGEQDGQPYLVMELLEGETLFHRLQRGAVGMPQLAQWGAEIADALQTAHAKGILHRDLKPANIFITQRGAVKVLDFGLAQFAQDSAAGADTMTSPGGAPLTTPGTTMGTWAYMSPEQARGEPTDARSDIFSAGVVLYEMAGGQAPFRGRTSADVSAAILTLAPPPPSSLQPAVPAKLDDIIAQCLEKDPDLRFQSAADLRVGLKRLQAPGSTAGPSSSVAPVAATPAVAAKRSTPGWVWPASAVVVLAAAGLVWWLRRGPAPPPTLQFHPLTYSGHVLDGVLSPDGKFLAHVDSTPAGTSLHLLSIASNSDVQIVPPGNGCCQSPSFSPDGGQVYFLQSFKLKAVPVLGGAVRAIAELACSGAGFSPDGSQIAFMADVNKLTLASPDGSGARLLATEQAGGGFVSACWNNGPSAFHAPAWSPDGSSIATLIGPATGDMHLQTVSTRDGSIHNLGPAMQAPGQDVNWLPDGRGLIFTATIPESDPPQLWEMSYPGGRMTRLTNDLQGYVGASLGSNGALTLVHAAPQASVWAQSKPGGAFQELPGGGASLDGAYGLAWTPAGELLSVREFGAEAQIWSTGGNLANAHRIAIPGAPQLVQRPVVAPDGRVYFSGSNDGVNGQWKLYSALNDGSGLRQLLHLQPGQIVSGGLALVHGGTQIVYLQIEKTEQHLWIANADGSGAHQLLPDFILAASLVASPDGNRLVAVRRAGSTAERVLIDLRGSSPTVTPVPGALQQQRGLCSWSPDASALVCVQHQGSSDNLWTFPLDGGPPRPLTHFDDLSIPAYAISHDGRWAVSRRSPNSDVVVATGLGRGH